MHHNKHYRTGALSSKLVIFICFYTYIVGLYSGSRLEGKSKPRRSCYDDDGTEKEAKLYYYYREFVDRVSRSKPLSK
jgi:hypothetical protein